MTPAVYLVILMWFGDSAGAVKVPQASMQACEEERDRIESKRVPVRSSFCVKGVKQ